MFDEQEEKSLEQDLNTTQDKKEENVQINVTNKRKRFNNFKIKYKKDKKKYLVAMSALCAMLAMTMGSSYAYLTYVSKTDNTVILDAGTLALTFRNEQNVISLENAVPVKDQVGLEQEQEYSFDIKNNGTIPAIYTITLNNICETGNEIDACIPDDYIKVGIKAGNADYKVVERNEKDKYIIATGSLDANESDKYKMKVWLDHATPNTYNAQNNQKIVYKGKLGLIYEQGKSKPQANYVYRYGTDIAYNSNPLAAGTYNGYCAINTNEDYNSCTQENRGFIAQSACESYIGGLDGEICQTGSWTVEDSISFAENATTLNKQFYLKYNIGTQTEVLESYVCYILNNNEYCLKGGDGVYDETVGDLLSPSYETNKQILQDSFGASNCTDNTRYYECSSAPLFVRANLSGHVYANASVISCRVNDEGDSYCHSGGASPEPEGQQ